MSKIKLGNPPKSFKGKVEIPTIDGKTSEIVIDFIYRTKTQYGAFIDQLKIDNEKTENDKQVSVENSIKLATKSNVDFVLKIAQGWDLSDEFNAENIAALDDQYPGAIAAIGDLYRLILLEGRVKN